MLLLEGSMYWNKAAETMGIKDLQALQTERLQKVVERCYAKSLFYQEKFAQSGVLPQDIRTLADITRLPFTTKQDMRDNYPYGMLTVPISSIARFHSSSGTTGRPTAVGYTRGDIAVWAETLGRTLVAGGLGLGSVFQVSVNYGMFTGGLGMHYAAEHIGATVLPVSSGNTAKQILLMQDFGTTAMVSTPSYALYLAETMREMGVDPQNLALRTIFCGAEAWTEKMRAEIESNFNAQTIDVYGLSEIIGPGVASECPYQNGLHLWEDHFYPEVIDPATGEILPEGETGELVLTTLTKQGMPMLRYRTRDLTSLWREKCACGRTTIKMKKVLGRNDDMLIIRGVNIFPSQVESVLLGMDAVAPHYQLIVERENNLDKLTVIVEMTDERFSDETAALGRLEQKIQGEIKNILGVKAKVKLVNPRTIVRSEGKAKRVIDNRHIE